MAFDPHTPSTIEEALEQFLLQLRADGRSEHTARQYERHVRALLRWLAVERESTDLAALTPQVVARFMVSPEAKSRPDGKPKKPTALNGLRSSIRGFGRYLHEAGLVAANPARLLRRALCSPARSRALDEGEVERLLAVLQEGTDRPAMRDRVLYTLMLNTGIRIGSALGLDVEDVDLDRGELILRGAKGNRTETAFLPESVVPLLTEHVATVRSGALFRNGGGERLTARHANRRLVGCFERAEIRRVRGTHCLRHSFAVSLYRRTGDVLLVREALLHRSIASTLAYTERDDARLRAAVGHSGHPSAPDSRRSACLPIHTGNGTIRGAGT